MRLGKSHGFTLVELIVVITILAILATVGFVSYSNYIPTARDANRVSEIGNIIELLQTQRASGKLPIPDDKVDIELSGNIIAYQGYAGESVLNALGYSGGGVDPVDNRYFTYYVTKDRKSFQILAFFEEGTIASIFPQTYATEYTNRFPRMYGDRLGIITETAVNGYTPLQEVVTGTFDLTDSTGSTDYIAHISDSEKLEGDEEVISASSYNASCKRLQQSGKSGASGRYTINPAGTGNIQVYCDMETDGGGWTLVDNKLEGETITERSLGVLSNLNTTKGVLFPAYSWGATAELMVKSNYYDGDLGWVSFQMLTSNARNYPISNNPISNSGATGHFSINNLNGNTDHGDRAWITNESARIGTVWIGNGSQSTASCGYRGYQSGIGGYNHTASCSTWVR